MAVLLDGALYMFGRRETPAGSPLMCLFQFGICGSLAWVAWYWVYIKFLAPAGIPNITVSFTLPWIERCVTCSFAPMHGVPSLMFLFFNGLVGAIFSTATFVTYGALLFDLVPSNLMGTLASGFGLISSVLGALFMNMCGVFVKYYSRLFYPLYQQDVSKYDYTSIYVFQIIFGVIGVGLYGYFLWLYKRGKVIEYGKLEITQQWQQEPSTP